MVTNMSTLQTQYKNYLKDNPYSKLTYEEWLKELSVSLAEGAKEELNDWNVTLMDGLENEPPYISDDFQIGPDGAHEHVEYSIPIYENGIKTKWSVDGVVGDEKYYQLLKLGNGKDLPDMINTNTKQ